MHGTLMRSVFENGNRNTATNNKRRLHGRNRFRHGLGCHTGSPFCIKLCCCPSGILTPWRVTLELTNSITKNAFCQPVQRHQNPCCPIKLSANLRCVRISSFQAWMHMKTIICPPMIAPNKPRVILFLCIHHIYPCFSANNPAEAIAFFPVLCHNRDESFRVANAAYFPVSRNGRSAENGTHHLAVSV